VIIDLRRGMAALAGLLLAALFALLVLPPLATPVATKQAAASPAPEYHAPKDRCGSLQVPPHYYTYQDNKESAHAFGPKVNPQDTRGELRRRLCGYTTPSGVAAGGDWSLLRALQGMVDGTDPNRSLTQSQWQREVRDFVGRIQWDYAQVVREAARSTPSYTLYMTGTGSRPPILHSYHRDGLKPSTFLLISVREKSGDVAKLKLRLDCGFQPEFLHKTPNTPKELTLP